MLIIRRLGERCISENYDKYRDISPPWPRVIIIRLLLAAGAPVFFLSAFSFKDLQKWFQTRGETSLLLTFAQFI
jgi:hypothetical protein